MLRPSSGDYEAVSSAIEDCLNSTWKSTVSGLLSSQCMAQGITGTSLSFIARALMSNVFHLLLPASRLLGSEDE